MGSWVNTSILFDPLNWIVVVLVLIFAAYAAYAIKRNIGSFPTPSLPVSPLVTVQN